MIEASNHAGLRAPTTGFRGSATGLRVAAGCVALAGLVVCTVFIPHADRATLVAAMIAVFSSYFVFRNRHGGFDYFETFFVYGLFFIVNYGIGVVYASFDPGILFRPSLESQLTPTAAVALLAFVCSLLGYATTFRSTMPSPMGRLDATGRTTVVLLGGVGCMGYLAGALQDRIIHGGAGVSAPISALQQFAFLFLVAWFLAWYRYFGYPDRSRRDGWSIVLLSPLAAMIVFVSIGSKEVSITIFAIPLVAYWFAARRFPVKSSLVLLLVTVFVVFPIYNTYREQTRQTGTVAKLERTVHWVSRWNSGTYFDRSVFAFASRLSNVASPAAVLQDAGTRVDFKYGATLILAPISVLIPRLFWPDKPRIVIGREFGVTFRLVNPQDRATQIAPSAFGEFYWNFHLPGVVAGMFGIGALLKWLYRRYGAHRGYAPIGLAFYVSVLSSVLQFEGGVAATAAGIFVRIVTFSIILAVLRYFHLVVDVTESAT